MALFGGSNSASGFGAGTSTIGTGGGGGFGTGSTAAANTNLNTVGMVENDLEVADPPNDSVSSLAFSSAGEFLAVGSWNNEVRFVSPLPRFRLAVL